jgi:hypothetical protein
MECVWSRWWADCNDVHWCLFRFEGTRVAWINLICSNQLHCGGDVQREWFCTFDELLLNPYSITQTPQPYHFFALLANSLSTFAPPASSTSSSVMSMQTL